MPKELEDTWTAVRGELRQAVEEITFQLWLEPLTLVARDGTTLVVRAPNHARDLVEERYLPLLRAAARRVTDAAAAVEIVGPDWTPAPSAGPSIDLNPRYTFEQFVIGPGNRFAHAAALAVAEQPGHAYNPLFIHGPPGLGKTHLLHAIANYARERNPSLAVRYATVEDFTGEFVQAMRRGDGEPFRRRFREADLLLLDDVQFLAERARTKEELFHTFNALYETGKQLVLSSDRSPSDLQAFEDRLRERFGSGLVTELERPDFDVRLAILRRRAAADVAGVAEEALEELARRVTSSVRALEGALVRVVAGASLRGQRPTPEIVRDLIADCDDDETDSGQELVEIGTIQAAVAEAYGVSKASLLAHDRRPTTARARQVAMYLTRELTDASLPAIGRAFGGRNHSTVLHSCRRVSRACVDDLALAATVDRLRHALCGEPDDRGQ
jgi:chromosomal replication initiator protein